MPGVKRPLAEVDPNASKGFRKSAKIEEQKASTRANERDEVEVEESKPTLRRRSARIQTVGSSAVEQPRSSLPKPRAVSSKQVDSDSKDVFTPTHKEAIEYSTKDNSKLRRFLVERHLSSSGTREELITRLENSSIDYNALSSEDLTTMLIHRNVTMYAQGKKDIKIQRLRINDKVDRDTGNGPESVLYERLSAYESILSDLLAKQDKHLEEMNEAYSKLSHRKLLVLLEKRKLPSPGNKETLTKRLQSDDRKKLSKHIRDVQKNRDAAKAELELNIGRPVSTAESVMEEDDKTERELSEIISRRGMPGGGPKAAMLKWLDTGNIDYEDMYVTPLRIICKERGIHVKSNAKRADLARLLREDDEEKEMK